MLDDLANALRWAGNLGKRFFQVFPLGTLLTIILTFFSQIALIASFLLPLKVIMLMGSTGIPRFLPPSFSHFDRDLLVISLSVLALSAYIFHVVSDKITSFTSNIGARKLLENSQKLRMFEDQDLIATNAYKRYSQSVATSAFFVLALTIVGILYPDGFLALVCFFILMTLGLILGIKLQPKLRMEIPQNLPSFANTISGLGFLFLFIFVILDFLFYEIPDFLPLIISIILSRQALNRLANASINIHNLHKQKEKLDALFFSDHTYQKKSENEKTSLWELISDNDLKSHVRTILTSRMGFDPGEVEFIWHQTGIKDVLFLFIGFKGLSQSFLLKVFGQRRSFDASHEATLLFDKPEGVIAPKLVDVFSIQGYRTHLMECEGISLPVFHTSHELKKNFSRQMLNSTASEELKAKCLRSQTMLWDRINIEMLYRLRTIATPQQKILLREADETLVRARAILEELPLTIYNRDQSSDTIYLAHNEDYGNLQWTKWSLEPIGSGWPTTNRALNELESVLSTRDEKVNRFGKIPRYKVLIAAIAFRLDTTFSAQRYSSAIRLLLKLKALLEENEA